jgi:uncharacterized protein YjbI with pentapeptide repeats
MSNNIETYCYNKRREQSQYKKLVTPGNDPSISSRGIFTQAQLSRSAVSSVIPVSITYLNDYYYDRNQTDDKFLTKTIAYSNYLLIDDANRDFLKKIDAANTYLTKTEANDLYLTQTTMTNNYLTKTEANDSYLTQTNASSIYLTQTNAESIYLTQTNAANNYLTQANLSSIYLTQTNASSIYLTQTNASSIYLTQTNAGNTYLTQANAGNTYLTQTTAQNTITNKIQYITTSGNTTTISGNIILSTGSSDSVKIKNQILTSSTTVLASEVLIPSDDFYRYYMVDCSTIFTISLPNLTNELSNYGKEITFIKINGSNTVNFKATKIYDKNLLTYSNTDAPLLTSTVTSVTFIYLAQTNYRASGWYQI